ncbi:hypothetical protein [Rhizobium ruizarguesonis]|uniref:hypothetical protein n=1 Tax=Rhizobium ruizarguesonis TaxID=2081791 RepID=UPI0013D76E62|nr:hypothetical protein [Rhizobium ruizarguesonis]NEH80569.1 hypothetical protein [Rhizobium ruizarguesonis]NEI75492.1 hypothetical protein [Rhizobium ruizarguesonis]
MNGVDYIFEIAKLGAQLSGAAFVGWIAVRWALARYKAEKIWDRRLSAYTEVISAFAQMQRVLAEWEDVAITHRDPSDDETSQLRQEYDVAEKSIRAVQGIAELLLPAEISSILQTIERDLYRAAQGADTWFGSIDARWAVIEEAKTKIVKISKSELGTA